MRLVLRPVTSDEMNEPHFPRVPLLLSERTAEEKCIWGREEGVWREGNCSWDVLSERRVEEKTQDTVRTMKMKQQQTCVVWDEI